MADFYVYDPAVNEYVGPIKGVDLSTIDILSYENYRTYRDPDGLWNAEFFGRIQATDPRTEWGLYLLLEKWSQDVSENGGVC